MLKIFKYKINAMMRDATFDQNDILMFLLGAKTLTKPGTRIYDFIRDIIDNLDEIYKTTKGDNHDNV